GALYGLSTMLMALVKDFDPDYIIAAYDLPKKTFRHEVYADYKSGRKALDDNLSKQLNRSRDVLKAFNIPIYEQEGFEADDVIGTIVEKMKKKDDIEIVIASGDMDTLQLVDGKKVRVYTLRKGIKDTIVYDEKGVKERFGFKPELLTDFKGLRGDPSDNIIGIPGIGEKTATDLITNFGTIEEIYKKLEKNEETLLKKGIKPRIINLLKENKEEAEFSKMLATINRKVPIKLELPKKSWREGLSSKNLRSLFTELDFRSILSRLDEMFGEEIEKKKEEEHNNIPERDVKETAVALWLLNSGMTNPTIQDILHFAKTDNFDKAKKAILEKIKKDDLNDLYKNIEEPLIDIVDQMKVDGIMIDKTILHSLSKEYHKKLVILEKEIWEMAGEEFNINSPKQMADILFVNMELSYKGMRKTKSGAYSTKEEVLQKLIEVHPIADKVLQYRELQKLVSTYIDNIPNHIKEDGRIHPTFIQSGAATGRMASQDPAVQNIPVKSEYGRRIRNAFVAPKGKRLVALDYSQVELRLAAILSDDQKLIQIFKNGEDVHTSVASFVFKVKPDEVTKEMRRRAKVINFGILYGMGVNALQKNLGTDRKEAQEFYNNYFETFKTLAQYLDNTKASAARKGYTETLFGRRRHFEGIKSSLPFIRAQAERMAINAPIQGTNADMVKLAMVETYKYIKKEKLDDKVKLLLQIHDEIIYEVDEDLVEETTETIRKIMEGVMKDKDTKGVPILVDASCGKNWGEMKEI
ncbi:MAG: DNA polymerase-1, partial [Candidatus Paceibacteria bacterium]